MNSFFSQILVKNNPIDFIARFFVVWLKLLFRAFPEKWKTRLRKVTWLSAINRYLRDRYNLWVVPTTATMQDKEYKRILAIQSSSLECHAFRLKKSEKIALLIMVPELNKVLMQRTISSIDKLVTQPVHIRFWCHKENHAQLTKLISGCLVANYDVVVDLFSEDVSNNYSWFIFFQGDMPNKNLLSAMTLFVTKRASIGYVDSDLLNRQGYRVKPELYPDWDPDLQLSTAYVNTGIWLSSLSLLDSNIALNEHSLALWLIKEYLKENSLSVIHLPWVLITRSKQFDGVSDLAKELSRTTLIGIKNVNCNSDFPFLHYQWDTKSQPLVSIIIPTYNGKDLVKTCIESITNKTLYDNFEILLVDNNSDDPEALGYFQYLADSAIVRLLSYPSEFNYSAINNFAVKHANGTIIALLNNDVEVISENWLDLMVGHALRSDIGCVGAKLLYPNDRLQHGGVVMGYGGGAGHAHKYFPLEHPGYLFRASTTNRFSAVTAACLVVKRSLFEAVNGLDEEAFKIAFNDVDFCLKVNLLGVSNLYCAEAVLYHHESVSRGHDDTPEKQERFASEVSVLKTRWAQVIANDPAYNPWLTRRSENFSLVTSEEIINLKALFL
jgi:GT2 family glycosyltransferase